MLQLQKIEIKKQTNQTRAQRKMETRKKEEGRNQSKGEGHERASADHIGDRGHETSRKEVVFDGNRKVKQRKKNRQKEESGAVGK